MIKLGVGLPAYGSKLDVGHAPMWLGVGVALASTADKFALRMFADYHIHGIDLCRNIIVWDALDSGCDWVFMVDADTFHKADVEAVGDAGVDILQMIMDGHRADAAAIGAAVRGRKVGDNAICVERRVPGQGANRRVSEREIAGQVVEVERVGAAFLAINCGWLREHWPEPPWFQMEYDFEGKPKRHRGEDYWFCDGVHNHGGKVLCDGRYFPAHVDRRKLVGEEDEA